ncbi:MAG: 3-isopropylmalate dehydrogenase [Armatimonadetes bacterium]|nr:3-isopropylmalate dehydrogenase [Armatimonadota bacterium]
MSFKVAVLPGDGIGPEVIDEAIKVLKAAGFDGEYEFAAFGGAGYDECGDPLPPKTLDLCKASDAVLMGAVGGPKWDNVQPITKRPEIGGLLPLRRELNLFANLRPAKTLQALLHASPLKEGRSRIDLMVVRELTGGIYFGEPRERRDNGNTAIDSMVYSRSEIERIAKRGFEVAMSRRQHLVSVDKANVLETSRLWREVVDEMAKDYPKVSLSHMLVDNCAMQLVRDPSQFDVILTENMFGDILSDEASMITGSLGLLPSASLSDAKGDNVFGLYEPVHGSAPDIAGQGRANPLAAILSASMMVKYSFGDDGTSARIDNAVEKALGQGLRTADIFEPGTNIVSTSEMGNAVAECLTQE